MRLIFNFLKAKAGTIFEFQNITNDLGIDLKTTRKYFGYLKNSFLINYCLNQTKKPVKSARTAKKIYLTSTNFFQGETGLLVENYVFNQLFQNREVKFYRKGNFEVDFVIERGHRLLAVEVKAATRVSGRDVAGLRSFRAEYGSAVVGGESPHSGKEFVGWC